MQVDRHPSPVAFSEKSNYPARPPFPPPPPPWHPSNDSSRYHTSTYSSSPREGTGYRSQRTVSKQNNYPSSHPIPPPPPPPPPSFSKNEFYSLTPPPSPPPSSFERNSNFSSSRPPPPPPPPSFFEKRNYDSSPPTPPSQSFFEKKDDSPPPSPPLHSSNDSSRGTNDSSTEIAIASLGIGILGTLANLACLGFAVRQDGTTRASLQLSTALAIKDLIAVHGVEGTRAIISSGIRTTVQDAQLIAELLTTGARTTRTGASSLANGVASSVTSLRSRLPSLRLYGPGTPSPTPNPSPSAPAEGLTASEAPNEEEHGIHSQLEEEPNVPGISDGTLPNFEPGEVPDSIFIVGTVSEVDNDELGESAAFPGDDTGINHDEPEESTIVRDDTDTSIDEPEGSTIVRMDGTETITDEPEESTIVQDDTEINNNELEENAMVRRDNTEIYTNELEVSALVWSNQRAKVLVSFDLFPIFHSEPSEAALF